MPGSTTMHCCTTGHAHERSRAVAQEEMKVKDSRVPKIVSACFASGTTTFLTLLIAAPSLGVLWAMLISVLVGGSVGYFGYQFREVLRAIPKAARASIPVVVSGFGNVQEFFSKPRPFLSGDLLASAIFSIAFLMNVQLTEIERQDWLLIGSLVAFFSFVVIAMLQAFYLGVVLNWRDSTKEKWKLLAKDSPDVHAVFNAQFPIEVLMASISWRYMLELHWDAFMNVVIGVLLFVVGVIGGIIAIPFVAIYFGGKFLWYLIKIIHSDHRLICGVNGSLGGLATFFALWAYHGPNFMAIPAWEKFAWVITAGVVSVGLGLIAHFFIGLRWLKTLVSEVVSDL